MFKIVSDEKEIERLHSIFSQKMESHLTEIMHVYIGYKGENKLLDVSYSSDLNIWWTFQRLSDRHWNSFGVGIPSRKSNNSITCEINYSFQGFNTSLAGGFAANEEGEVILIHSGRIGGGRKGIGKTLFTDNYIGEIVPVKFKNNVSEYAPIGSFDSVRFGSQVALFVHEISRIKELSKNIHTPSRVDTIKNGIKTTFNKEFAGEKEVKQRERSIAICDHGLIVNEYKRILEQKGEIVANDRERDLYIISKDRINTVFEFKTNYDRQSIYTGIGQLLLNNRIFNPAPRMVLSLPVGLSEDFKRVINSLDIEILEYQWKNNKTLEFLI